MALPPPGAVQGCQHSDCTHPAGPSSIELLLESITSCVGFVFFFLLSCNCLLKLKIIKNKTKQNKAGKTVDFSTVILVSLQSGSLIEVRRDANNAAGMGAVYR